MSASVMSASVCASRKPQAYKGHLPPELAIARIAAIQHGVISSQQLVSAGLTRTAVAVRVRRGQLHMVHRAVYAVGHDGLTIEARFLAALLACGPSAVLSHFSAAAVMGLVCWDDRYPQVTVPATGHRGHRGIRVHRTRSLDAGDVRRVQGIRVTSAARTALDLTGELPESTVRRIVRRAQAKRLTNIPDLTRLLSRTRGRRGTATLAAVVATGPAPTRSELEDVILDLILGAGFAPPDVNVAMHLVGRRVVPDFRWPAQHLVLEADGAAWHDGKLEREDDAERQALLEAYGNRVLRVTWDDAVLRPGKVLARLRHAGAPLAT